jgi:hypothetical protein
VYTQFVYKISEFNVDKPKPSDLLIEFPPGTKVADSVRHQLYMVDKDGGKEFLPNYDVATGKIISATQQAAVDAAATQTTTQPTMKPAGK